MGQVLIFNPKDEKNGIIHDIHFTKYSFQNKVTWLLQWKNVCLGITRLLVLEQSWDDGGITWVKACMNCVDSSKMSYCVCRSSQWCSVRMSTTEWDTQVLIPTFPSWVIPVTWKTCCASGYHTRRLTWWGQHWDWLAQCQYTVNVSQLSVFNAQPTGMIISKRLLWVMLIEIASWMYSFCLGVVWCRIVWVNWSLSYALCVAGIWSNQHTHWMQLGFDATKIRIV